MSFRSVFILFGLLFIPCERAARGQNTADALYLAIQQVQIRLGESEAADRIRDRYLIRELETASALGFTVDPSVFLAADAAMANSAGDEELIGEIRERLRAHLSVLQQRAAIQAADVFRNLDMTMPEVTLDNLSDARDTLIAVLREQVAWQENNLSHYGAVYADKALGLSSLIRQLEDYVFFEVDDLSGDPQEFNRNLNRFRTEIRNAKSRFAAKSVDYPNITIDRSERALARFEQLVNSYLLTQTTRALANFQEDLERRIRVLRETGLTSDPAQRLFHAEVGRYLGLLRERGADPGLEAAIRGQFSHPNFHLTVSETWANRLGSRPIHRVSHLDEVILGSRAQGLTWVNGSVTYDFLPNPHSAVIRVHMGAYTNSSAYTKEGPVTAYTSTEGFVGANRNIAANIGNISVYPATGFGRLQSTFHGTDCIPFVDRIAFRQFMQKKQRAEEISSERAQARVASEFATESDLALTDGLTRMEAARAQRFDFLARINEFRRRFSRVLGEDEEGRLDPEYEVIDPFILPRAFVTTTDTHLHVGAVLEGDNRLAATTLPPGPVMPVDFRIQIHESMIANLVAPFLQGRLMQNWQFGRLADSLSSGRITIPEPKNQQRWAIRFEAGRPIQVAFDANELVVTLWGREFRREGGNASPLNISFRARIVNDNGKLRLVRVSKPRVDYTYLPGEGRTLSPEDIAFRQFLQDNLEESMAGDAMERAIELPDNLLFVDVLENEQLSKLVQGAVLVECSAENGWLNLGWTFGDAVERGQVFYTPAIWNEVPAIPPVPAEEPR